MKTFSNFLVTFLAQWKIVGLTAILITTASFCMAQVPGLEAKHWYFGSGNRGLAFNGTPINTTQTPTLLTNKFSGVGYEGMVVVNDPNTGDLLFYSDGIRVINRNHLVMTGGSGLIGHSSGAQTVLCLPVPGVANQYYLLHHAAYDGGSGPLYATIVDFTSNSLGEIPALTKNVLISNYNYSQANMLVSKPCTDDFWWIGHVMNTNQYKVISISSSGFGPDSTYTLSNTATGDSYAMVHSPKSNKIAISGTNLMNSGTLGLILANFDSNSGIISNGVTIFPTKATLGNFSPDGTKLYFNDDGPAHSLHQYDLVNGVTTNMNTCCYAHDTKVAPNGKMYHMRSYSTTQPIAVINCPNLSAVSNACGYIANGGVIGNFNGEVRRFPTFLAMPYCPMISDTVFPCMIILGPRFTNFQVNVEDNGTTLAWSIAEPCDGCDFEIERQNAKGFFESIGAVDANAKTSFEYLDSKSHYVEVAYRIKLRDTDGMVTYSEVIWVNLNASRQSELVIYPNPCFATLNVSVGTQNDVTANVYDLAGKSMLSTVISEGYAALDLSTIPAGSYVLKLTLNGNVVCKLFHKQN